METLKAISLRKSVRAFMPKPISNDILDTIIQTGCKAPVASGKYDTLHITVVQNTEILKLIAEATSDIIYQATHIRKNADFGAPVIIFISSTSAIISGIEYANAACVPENMVLAATDQNIDSIIWGAPAVAVQKDIELRKLLKIPNGYKPILCASFGYAKADELPKEHAISISKIE